MNASISMASLCSGIPLCADSPSLQSRIASRFFPYSLKLSSKAAPRTQQQKENISLWDLCGIADVQQTMQYTAVHCNFTFLMSSVFIVRTPALPPYTPLINKAVKMEEIQSRPNSTNNNLCHRHKSKLLTCFLFNRNQCWIKRLRLRQSAPQS